jgi:3-hydroxyisobutyrate dehydrogenase/glyoxylate/succinic semialdehyde reductase
MVNNLLGAVAMAAFAEGTALGEALGVPRQTMFDALLGGSMTPPMLSAKRGKIERGDYEPEFPLRLIQKDLHLASISAYEAGVPMAVVNVTKEIYRLAMNDGYADQDFAAIYAFLHRAAVPQDRVAHPVGASD